MKKKERKKRVADRISSKVGIWWDHFFFPMFVKIRSWPSPESRSKIRSIWFVIIENEIQNV